LAHFRQLSPHAAVINRGTYVSHHTADQVGIDCGVEADFSAGDAGEFAREFFALCVAEFVRGVDLDAFEAEIVVD